MKQQQKHETKAVENIKKLIEQGRQWGSLTYGDIMDALAEVDLSAEQIDDVYEQLSQLGIEIVPAGEGFQSAKDDVPEPTEKDLEEEERESETVDTVSYTHLDVYKRQLLYCVNSSQASSLVGTAIFISASFCSYPNMMIWF